MQERTAGPMAGFFKFVAQGQAIAGLVKRHFNGDNGHAFILSPCVILSPDTGETKMYDAAAVGLSTDMLIKVDVHADIGKVLFFKFVSTEPSAKGSPRKIFQVGVLSPGEFDKMTMRVHSRVKDVYQPIPFPEANQTAPTASVASDDEYDLPF